jgi:hypothetical protein
MGIQSSDLQLLHADQQMMSDGYTFTFFDWESAKKVSNIHGIYCLIITPETKLL